MNPTPILGYHSTAVDICLSIYRSFGPFHFLFSDKGRYQTNPWLLLCFLSCCFCSFLFSDRSYRLSVCPSQRQLRSFLSLDFFLFFIPLLDSFLVLFYFHFLSDNHQFYN